MQGEDEGANDDSVEQVQDLEGRLKDLENELQYAKAEIANVGQRAARDRAELLRYGGASLARRIIPIIDLLEKAVSVSDLEGANESIIEGVKLTLDNLRTSFEAELPRQILPDQRNVRLPTACGSRPEPARVGGTPVKDRQPPGELRQPLTGSDGLRLL